MTINREDYLKAIYELGGETKRVGTKEIATNLKVSPPSVSEMIKTLVREGYVVYELYRGVVLTPDGLDKAKKIKRRHLLWEVFLVEKLGYSWEDVHVEAEILEHVTSPRLERQLEKYLDYPETCPHGTPISSGNQKEPVEYTSLDTLKVGETAIIKRFEDEKTILQYVKRVGLSIGDIIEINSENQSIITLTVKEGESIEIRRELTKQIYVKRGELK